MQEGGSALVVHYAEIGTKGNNRPVFERYLQRNLSSRLEPLGRFSLELIDQRLLVSSTDGDANWGAAVAAVKEVFGVAWVAVVRQSPLGYGAARDLAVAEMGRARAASGESTFRVTAKRANKAYPMTSQEFAVALGADLQASGLKVDLSDPGITLFADILSDRILLYTTKGRGPGGLPVGVTGKVVHLLSGGIDSPVAAYLMMKRGCDPTYLHFYVAPSAERILETKMPRILGTLSRFAPGNVRMVLVPFTEYQVATADLRQDYEPTVFRHFMRVVAERVALREGALAISTGDNLGQVASQTLHNMACIDAGASAPTFRPVLAFDKSEIIELAERIGTYRDSVAEYKDCCSIVGRHPRTRMDSRVVLEAARRYDFAALAERTLSLASVASLDQTAEMPTLRAYEPAPQVKAS